MPLGEFSIFCFEFLSDFWRKLQKKKKKKIGKSGMFGFLRRSEELCRNVGLPRRNEVEEPERPPWLCYGVALLHRGVGTVHRGKIFGFCFRAPRFCVPIVLGTLINDQWGFK